MQNADTKSRSAAARIQRGSETSSAQSEAAEAFFMPPVQAKLTINQPGDPYEQEADRVADQVVQRLENPSGPAVDTVQRMPITPLQRSAIPSHTPIQARCAGCEQEEKLQKKEEEEQPIQEKIQRKPIFESGAEPPDEGGNVQRKAEPGWGNVQMKCASCEAEEQVQEKEEEELPIQEKIQRKPIFDSGAEPPDDEGSLQRKAEPALGSIQMKCAACEQEEKVQREGGDSAPSVPTNFSSRLQSSKGGGSPLPAEVSSSMGEAMGADFSSVRVHTGSEAVGMSNSIQAQAFTHGSDVYFNEGKYDTTSSEGQHLLAHELTHTVQQGEGQNMINKAGNNGTPTSEGVYEGPEGKIDLRKESQAKFAYQIEKAMVPDFKLIFTTDYATIQPYEERQTTQREKWKKKAFEAKDNISKKIEFKANQEGSPSQIKDTNNSRVYFFQMRGSKNDFLIGTMTEVINSIIIPSWSISGARATKHVDHKQEIQLGGKDEIENMWLLEERANMSSGSKINNELNKQIQQLINAADTKNQLWKGKTKPTPNSIRKNSTVTVVKYDKSGVVAGDENDRFHMTDIAQDVTPLKGLKALTKAEIEGKQLQGTNSNIKIFFKRSDDQARGWFFDVPNWEDGKTTNIGKKVGNMMIVSLNYTRSGIDGKPTGTLNVIAFKTEGKGKSKVKLVSEKATELTIKEMPGMNYSGYVSMTEFRSKVKDLHFIPMSLINTEDMSFDEVNGVLLEGKIDTKIPFLQGTDINIIIDGEGVRLSKVFSTGELNKLPAPFSVSNTSLEISVGSNGFLVSGDIDFGIKGFGEGRIKGQANSGGWGLSGDFVFDKKLFGSRKNEGASIKVEYSKGYDDGKGNWSIGGHLTIGKGRIKGLEQLNVDIKYENEILSGTGSAKLSLPGIDSASINVEVDNDGDFSIKAEVALDKFPKIKKGAKAIGNVSKQSEEWDMGLAAEIEFDLNLANLNINKAKFEYNKGAFDIIAGISYGKEGDKVYGVANLGLTNKTLDNEGKKQNDTGGNKINFYADGSLNIKITDDVIGSANLKVLPNGEDLLLNGEVKLANDKPLLKQLDYGMENGKPSKNLLDISKDIPFFSCAVATVYLTFGVYGGVYAILEPLTLKDTSKIKLNNLSLKNPADTSITSNIDVSSHLKAGIQAGIKIGLTAGILILKGKVELDGNLDFVALDAEAEAHFGASWSAQNGFELKQSKVNLNIISKLIATLKGRARVYVDLWLKEIDIWEPEPKVLGQRTIEVDLFGNGSYSLDIPIKDGKPALEKENLEASVSDLKNKMDGDKALERAKGAASGDLETDADRAAAAQRKITQAVNKFKEQIYLEFKDPDNFIFNSSKDIREYRQKLIDELLWKTEAYKEVIDLAPLYDEIVQCEREEYDHFATYILSDNDFGGFAKETIIRDFIHNHPTLGETERTNLLYLIQNSDKKSKPNGKKRIQRKESSSNAIPPVSSSLLGNSHGEVLSESTRQQIEPTFGADFSQVRIHTDSQANAISELLEAQAFTHGNDIYFNEGKFNPEDKEGQRLLAHELTHVVQQRGGDSIQEHVQRRPMEPNYSTWSEMLAQNRALAGRLTVNYLMNVLQDRRIYIFNETSLLGHAELLPIVRSIGRGVFGVSGGNIYRFEENGTYIRVQGVPLNVTDETEGTVDRRRFFNLADLLQDGLPNFIPTHVDMELLVLGPQFGQASSEQSQSPQEPDDVPQDTPGVSDPMERIAMLIHEALSFNDDEARVVSLMNNRSAEDRTLIQHYFRERFNLSLENFLILEMHDMLNQPTDELIKSLALLEVPDWNSPELLYIKIGLAILPNNTRDEQLFAILESTIFSNLRRETIDAYNRTYSRIGEGSLRADLEEDLSLGDEEKALMLIDHDLTDADHIFLDTIGTRLGTNTPAVIQRLQQIWDRGFQAFEQLEIDWNAIPEDWRERHTLRQALEDELSGERQSWDIILPMLNAYERWQQNQLAPNSSFSEEDTQLDVATETLEAAMHGGYVEWGRDEEQIFRALGQISTIYQNRLIQASSESERDHIRIQWRVERQRLLGLLAGEFEEGTDHRQAQLLIFQGHLSDADKIWLADERREYEEVAKIATRVWQQGPARVATVQADAAEPLYHSEPGMERVWLRNEVFLPPMLTRINSPENARRVEILLGQEHSHALKGAMWINRELREHRNEAGLRAVYRFLSENDITLSLRQEVIQEYVESYLRYTGEPSGRAPAEIFVSEFLNQFDASERMDAWFDLRDLILPTRDAQEITNRATQREQAEHSGWADWALTPFTASYDALTGEDTTEIVQDSLQQLLETARMAQTTPGELEGALALLGLRSTEDLVQLDYEEFNRALERSRETRHAIADTLATVVEISVELALTALTAGAGSGPLLASLGSAVAGMFAREALLGNQYTLISRENAIAITTAIAAQGFNRLGNSLMQGVFDAETLQRLSPAQRFFNDALSEGFSQGMTRLTEAAFSDRMPTMEALVGEAIAIASQSVGAGAQGAIAQRINGSTDRVTAFRNQIARSFAQSVIGGLGEETRAMVAENQQLNGGEIASRLSRRFVADSLQGISSGMAEFYGEERQHRQETLEQPTETDSATQEHLEAGEMHHIFDRSEQRDDYEETRGLDMLAHAESSDHLHHIEIYPNGGIGRCSPANRGEACPVIYIVFHALLQQMPRTRAYLVEQSRLISEAGDEIGAIANHLAQMEQRLRDLEENMIPNPNWEEVDEGFLSLFQVQEPSESGQIVEQGDVDPEDSDAIEHSGVGVLDDPILHQATSRGTYGEHVADEIVGSFFPHYQKIGRLTWLDDPDRGRGIDGVWRARGSEYDFAVSEAKYSRDFDGSNPLRLLSTPGSGLQLSDGWISGEYYDTHQGRLEHSLSEATAGRTSDSTPEQIREALRQGRVQKLLIVINQTGHSFVYIVSPDVDRVTLIDGGE